MLVIGMSCVAYRGLCSIFTKRCITFLGKYNVCAQKGSTSLEKKCIVSSKCTSQCYKNIVGKCGIGRMFCLYRSSW